MNRLEKAYNEINTIQLEVFKKILLLLNGGIIIY